MTDEAQTLAETVADQPAAVQDAGPVAEATETAPGPEAAPEAPETAPEPKPEEPAPAPVADPARDAVIAEASAAILAAVDDDAALTAQAKAGLASVVPVHNPNALRGVPAGPEPHPRSHHRHH